MSWSAQSGVAQESFTPAEAARSTAGPLPYSPQLPIGAAPSGRDIALLLCLHALWRTYDELRLPEDEALLAVVQRWVLLRVATFHEPSVRTRGAAHVTPDNGCPRGVERRGGGSAAAKAIAAKLTSVGGAAPPPATAPDLGLAKPNRSNRSNDVSADCNAAFDVVREFIAVFAADTPRQRVIVASIRAHLEAASEAFAALAVLATSLHHLRHYPQPVDMVPQSRVLDAVAPRPGEVARAPLDLVTRFLMFVRLSWDAAPLSHQSAILDVVRGWYAETEKAFCNGAPPEAAAVFLRECERVAAAGGAALSFTREGDDAPDQHGALLASLSSPNVPIAEAAIHAALENPAAAPLDLLDPFVRPQQRAAMTPHQRTAVAMLQYAAFYVRAGASAVALSCADVAIVAAHQASAGAIAAAAHALRCGCLCALGNPHRAAEDLSIGLDLTDASTAALQRTREVLLLAAAALLTHYPGAVDEGLRRLLMVSERLDGATAAAAAQRESATMGAAVGAVAAAANAPSGGGVAGEVVHTIKHSVTVTLRAAEAIGVMVQLPALAYTRRVALAAAWGDAARWLGLPFIPDDDDDDDSDELQSGARGAHFRLGGEVGGKLLSPPAALCDAVHGYIRVSHAADAVQHYAVLEALRRLQVHSSPHGALRVLRRALRLLPPPSRTAPALTTAGRIVAADAALHSGFALIAVEMLQPVLAAAQRNGAGSRDALNMTLLVDATSVLAAALLLLGRRAEAAREAAALERVAGECSHVHGVLSARLIDGQATALHRVAGAVAGGAGMRALAAVRRDAAAIGIPGAEAHAQLLLATAHASAGDTAAASTAVRETNVAALTAAQRRALHLLRARLGEIPVAVAAAEVRRMRHPGDTATAAASEVPPRASLAEEVAADILVLAAAALGESTSVSPRARTQQAAGGVQGAARRLRPLFDANGPAATAPAPASLQLLQARALERALPTSGRVLSITSDLMACLAAADELLAAPRAAPVVLDKKS